MSARMTDEKWDDLKDEVRRWGGIAENQALDECNRARRVEQEQADTIKALGDALWDARQYGDVSGELCWCQSPCNAGEQRPECVAKESALRIAGRIP